MIRSALEQLRTSHVSPPELTVQGNTTCPSATGRQLQYMGTIIEQRDGRNIVLLLNNERNDLEARKSVRTIYNVFAQREERKTERKEK